MQPKSVVKDCYRIGQSLTDIQLYFISRVFSLIAQCIGKISVLIFTRRIFSGNFWHERLLFQAAHTAVLLYGVCAVMLSSAGCHPRLTLLTARDLVCDSNVDLRPSRVLTSEAWLTQQRWVDGP